MATVVNNSKSEKPARLEVVILVFMLDRIILILARTLNEANENYHFYDYCPFGLIFEKPLSSLCRFSDQIPDDQHAPTYQTLC